jgi:hypothetical protein
MFTECALNAHWMFTEFPLNVPSGQMFESGKVRKSYLALCAARMAPTWHQQEVHKTIIKIIMIIIIIIIKIMITITMMIIMIIMIIITITPA